MKHYETPWLTQILLAPADVITGSLFKTEGNDGNEVDFFGPDFRY